MQKKSKLPIIIVVVLVVIAAVAIRYSGLFKSAPEAGKTEESKANPQGAAGDNPTVELRNPNCRRSRLARWSAIHFPWR